MEQNLHPKRANVWSLVLLLAVAIGVMVFIGKCSTRPQSPFAKEYSKAQGDTLDIGVELNPAVYYPSGDTIAGMDYEVLMRISEECGVPMKFHPFVPLAHAMDYLEKGLYDVVVASMPLTSDLKERFIMTEPVYIDREVLVQRRDSAGGIAVKSQIDLGGDTVWIPSQSSIRSRLENLAVEIGDSIHLMSDDKYTAEHLFLLVASGVIDLAVINESIASQLAHDYPGVDSSTPVSFSQFQAWAVNRERQALADSLNIWIKAVER